mgnify:CR=1 FL=1
MAKKEERGQGGNGADDDDVVMMPLKTVQRRFRGTDTLDLQKQPLPEDIPQTTRGLQGKLTVTGSNLPADQSTVPPGERNQPVGVIAEPVRMNHRRTTLLTVHVATGDQLHEIAVARITGAKQPQGIVGFGDRIMYDQVTAQNRFDTLGLRGRHELDGRKQVHVVGHRNRGHPPLGRSLDQRFDPNNAVHERILGVDTEMHKT